jgi:hypothetical protein
MSIKPEILIEHVNQSISAALRHQSWIHAEALDVKGFTSGVMIRLFANLVHLPIENPAYLEVGLYCGKSFCACMNNSPTLNLYGVEDFSQDFGDPSVRPQLEANIEKFKGDARSVTVINSDAFKVDLKDIKHKIQVYCFDGEHSYESQKKAIPYYLDAMDDTWVFICDDFDWSGPSRGTKDALAELKDKVKIEREWILTDGVPDSPTWHNGLGIFVLSKI